MSTFSTTQHARSTPFDSTTNGMSSTDVQSAIEEVRNYTLRDFEMRLHYVSGTGLNTTMSNGAFFRVFPGTFSSGSYSGYPAAFPHHIPYNCRLRQIVLTFREASFDWSATAGRIKFDIEFRSHYYNGSDVLSLYSVEFGNYSGSSTGHSTHKFFLSQGTPGFQLISGEPVVQFADMVGARFVKSSSGERRINSFVDIVANLIFHEEPT